MGQTEMPQYQIAHYYKNDEQPPISSPIIHCFEFKIDEILKKAHILKKSFSPLRAGKQWLYREPEKLISLAINQARKQKN
jgi:hypothetical protein